MKQLERSLRLWHYRLITVLFNYRLIYENIYNFCHDENDVLALTLDVDGNTAYEAFLDKIAETLNKQWEDQQECADVSKDDRHVLRLAAVLHIFYDQLQKRLSSEPASPPQALVKKETLEQAITLTSYFAEHRKILDQVGSRKYSDCIVWKDCNNAILWAE